MVEPSHGHCHFGEDLHPRPGATDSQGAGASPEVDRQGGEWIQILRTAGFAIDALHELYAPPDAIPHPYYDLATASWAQQWPVEEIWETHLTA
jgi:hypothetical protein